ncbi:MAG: ATP-binding protein [Okeania sp. SIO3I5]|uniref:P-loop NTPase fold protein n=1 Tax=Okeania sp. SIO3I5 TaxID=2607805 RepID=UPI0013B8BFA7|nr:P-loop NTPase fold protein [Okeania sp. SIO3I5]NEQ38223.1 ATP-binding protein [Okeania sp. SIO3I5]
MASIDQIIQTELNPFDPVTLYTINFWQEQPNPSLNVDSIHQNIITDIETVLEQVAQEHHPRTLILTGDSGSGKSYLLGRIKKLFNTKAFFVYIDPWPDSDYIWRHILRQTVDCLMKTPEGKTDSQLLLWLKSLLTFQNSSLLKKILGERRVFIRNLKAIYSSGIYNPNDFFSALYHLLDPKYSVVACEWLRGDDLDEGDLKSLGIKSSIDSEDSAQKIITNLGVISAASQPIVLCFDNLDNIPRLLNGTLDLQALFNVNSSIHSHYPQNFLIIISIITSTWKQNAALIQPADKARVNAGDFHLKPITLEQGEAILAARLNHLHSQAKPKPKSTIFPLSKEILEQKFPRGRTLPRNILELGRKEYEQYKLKLLNQTENTQDLKPETQLATFKLIWQDKYKKTQKKISKITDLGAPELIRMLEEVLTALQFQEVKTKLLTGKYASYSLSYKQQDGEKVIGLVWTEDSNMNSFYNTMNACQKVVDKRLCQTLYLLRAAEVGNAKNLSNKIYRKIFKGRSKNFHIKPNLESVYFLATYHSLVNATLANELVIEGEIISLKELEEIICDSQILNNCSLLQDLYVVLPADIQEQQNELNLDEIKDFVLSLIRKKSFMERNSIIENTLSQFVKIEHSKIDLIIAELEREQKIKVIAPTSKLDEQLVCFVPG